MFEKVRKILKCYSCTKILWCANVRISVLQGQGQFSEGSSAGYLVRLVTPASIVPLKCLTHGIWLRKQFVHRHYWRQINYRLNLIYEHWHDKGAHDASEIWLCWMRYQLWNGAVCGYIAQSMNIIMWNRKIPDCPNEP